MNENKKLENIRILDIGCGYGVVSVVLKRFFEKAKILSTDVNERALELTKENILLRSVLLAVVMTFLSNLIKSLKVLGIGVMFVLAYFAAFFRQIYLSRNVSLTTAFEKNTKLLENNRLRIILPLFLVTIISGIVTSTLTAAASVIVLKSLNSAMTVIAILIVYRILVGIFEIYKKILGSIIFLNVENNK